MVLIYDIEDDRLRTRGAERWLPDVLASLEIDELLKIRAGSRGKIDNLHYLKYFNVEGYVREHLQRAIFLGMQNSHNDVLDIGTGFGYFPYICMFFNNRAKATDLPGIPLFDEVTGFLGVDKVHHRIEPFQPLPDFGTKFHVINDTAPIFMTRIYPSFPNTRVFPLKIAAPQSAIVNMQAIATIRAI